MSLSKVAHRQLWRHPDPQQTQVDEFRRHLNKKYSLKLRTYQQLWEWSVADVALFSSELFLFAGIKCSAPPTSTAYGADKMWPRPQWFPGARLNYTENILSHVATLKDQLAISACREGGTAFVHLTWNQLYSTVEKWTDALRCHGVTINDRVAVVMPNCIESVVILLACGAIGAIFSSTSPEMGQAGIIQRYQQVKPKILFLDSMVFYNGKEVDLKEKMHGVGVALKSQAGLERIVVCRGSKIDIPGIETKTASDFLASGKGRPLRFEQLPFDHPIYILYSSGTTGPPKCICHSSGGALLQQKKEFILSNDVRPGDCYYQYTTVGWMMWNYCVAALSCGTRIVLYDGSPMAPNCSTQLDIVEQQGVTFWGTSPKFLSALKSEGVDVNQTARLKKLNMVASSGSVLTPEMFEWFYDVFPKRIALCSGSGGTDLVAGIVMGTPLLPIYSGEIQASQLGMKVEIWNRDGKDIEDTGEPGDLIITKPFLSMPTKFWGEDGEKKYQAAYFSEFPGVWYHGDYIKKNTDTGGYEVLGRSDGVLNPGGVRFGSAELYNVLERFPDILDSLAVGQRRKTDTDESVLVFLKLKPSLTLTADLVNAIKNAIKASLSPRHVPKYVLQVRDIPYTANGKKVENVVRDVVSGRVVKVSGTVVNPECLEEYAGFVGLGKERGAKL